jgi:hypothetical protein
MTDAFDYTAIRRTRTNPLGFYQQLTDKSQPMEHNFETATRQVREARAIVERQRQMVEFRKKRGWDCELSISLLATFKATLAVFESELTRLSAGA